MKHKINYPHKLALDVMQLKQNTKDGENPPDDLTLVPWQNGRCVTHDTTTHSGCHRVNLFFSSSHTPWHQQQRKFGEGRNMPTVWNALSFLYQLCLPTCEAWTRSAIHRSLLQASHLNRFTELSSFCWSRSTSRATNTNEVWKQKLLGCRSKCQERTAAGRSHGR